ncbi:MAG: methionine synthase [Chloroflexota bacterium]
MTPIEFGCLPTAIGSLPHSSPEESRAFVLKYLPDIPAWPQLPRRSPGEVMTLQFSSGFPGLVTTDDKPRVERNGFDAEAEALYRACEQQEAEKYAVAKESAAGLHAFLSLGRKFNLLKGQMTGPVTWGLSVADERGVGVIYDETLAEAVVKFLSLKARWQERALQRIARNTIVFLDEPCLSSFGSPFLSLPAEKVTGCIDGVLSALEGIKGVHCCGATDWSLLTSTRIDVLSFDAYNYADSISAHPEVKGFVEKGGAIAWGIVPNVEADLARETVSSIHDRLGEAIAPFTRSGVPFKTMVAQGLLTPSCGLAGLSLDAAAQALELLAGLSARVRQRYA